MAAAMVGHLLGPLAWTNLVSSASSEADHGALPDVGAARGGLFFAPPLDLLEEVGRVAVAAFVGVAGGGSRGAAGSGLMPPLRVERRGWGTGGGGGGGGGASVTAGAASVFTGWAAGSIAVFLAFPGRLGSRRFAQRWARIGGADPGWQARLRHLATQRGRRGGPGPSFGLPAATLTGFVESPLARASSWLLVRLLRPLGAPPQRGRGVFGEVLTP